MAGRRHHILLAVGDDGRVRVDRGAYRPPAARLTARTDSGAAGPEACDAVTARLPAGLAGERRPEGRP